MKRRTFLARLSASTSTLATLGGLATASERPKRRMTIDLVPGAIGVRVDQEEAIDLAAQNGFESVAPYPRELTEASSEKLARIKTKLDQARLIFGASRLPVNFRSDEESFRNGLRDLPKYAAGLQRAGVSRIGTYIIPSHETLTYRENFHQHVSRLREVADILQDQAIRLGLEYVGPKTSWTAARHSFVHTMRETRELVSEIGLSNVGLVLDSWHWYHARETAADIEALQNRDVVAVDLNDAPTGIPIDEHHDLKRELPAQTGVIDVKTFLSALVAIAYNGPVRAEPFNAKLRSLPKFEAVAATAKAMKKAFAAL